MPRPSSPSIYLSGASKSAAITHTHAHTHVYTSRTHILRGKLNPIIQINRANHAAKFEYEVYGQVDKHNHSPCQIYSTISDNTEREKRQIAQINSSTFDINIWIIKAARQETVISLAERNIRLKEFFLFTPFP